MLIAPEPVPRSTKVIFSLLLLNIPEIISIISSVSGRGIRTLFVTSNLRSLQKEIPLKYCMGIEVLRCLSQKISSKSKLIFKPLPLDDPRQRQPNLTKAKAELDWAPSVSLNDGLKETINYFKKIVG